MGGGADYLVDDHQAMRYLRAAFVYLFSLSLVAAAAFIVEIVIAGPHAGLLPQWAEVIVLVLGWLAVLVLPVLASRVIWLKWLR